MTARRCCGLCHQGRRLCPTPEDCRIPANTPPADAIDAFLRVFSNVFGAIAVLAFIALLITSTLFIFKR